MFQTYRRHTLSNVSMFMLVFCMLAFARASCAQEGYQPTAANLSAREWFQNAKFGLFIHWGV